MLINPSQALLAKYIGYAAVSLAIVFMIMYLFSRRISRLLPVIMTLGIIGFISLIIYSQYLQSLL